MDPQLVEIGKQDAINFRNHQIPIGSAMNSSSELIVVSARAASPATSSGAFLFFWNGDDLRVRLDPWHTAILRRASAGQHDDFNSKPL